MGFRSAKGWFVGLDHLIDFSEQVVIGPEVVDGKARPLYIYSERQERSGASA